MGMELMILNGLLWRVHPPTSLQVGNQILSLLLSQIKMTSLEQTTWTFVRGEMAYQTEMSVRDYYFTTKRPSTIAAAAIMNAIEQVSDHDYKLLMMALRDVLKELEFDSPIVLLEARDKLHHLMKENEEIDCDSLDVSETTRSPVLEAPSRVTSPANISR